MSGINVLWFFLSIFLIGLGAAKVNSKWNTKLIRLGNRAKGVKTEIKSDALLVGKVMGWGMIAIGVISLLFIFVGY